MHFGELSSVTSLFDQFIVPAEYLLSSGVDGGDCSEKSVISLLLCDNRIQMVETLMECSDFSH